MASTLAPSALDNEGLSRSGSGSASLSGASAPSSGLNLDFGNQDNKYSFQGPGSTIDATHGGYGSGQLTPGEGFWDSFVQDGGWSEEGAAN